MNEKNIDLPNEAANLSQRRTYELKETSLCFPLNFAKHSANYFNKT